MTAHSRDVSDATCATADPVRALVGHLAELHAVLKELHEIATAKLGAMRRADAAALQRCAGRESRLLEQALRLARVRPAMIARAAQSLPTGVTSAATLAEICERSPEPISSTLRARMRGLEEIAVRLRESNRIAALVARELHTRVRDLFATLASMNRDKCGYGPQGRETHRAGSGLFEAVG